MKRDQFIVKLRDELELEAEIVFSTNLRELDEWDSMTAMVLIGFVSDNFGLTMTGEDLKNINSINALIDFIGSDKIN
jgi:acyl carrier protein